MSMLRDKLVAMAASYAYNPHEAAVAQRKLEDLDRRSAALLAGAREKWRSEWRAAAMKRRQNDPRHVHGWARVNDVWTCIQDHWVSGFRPETACGLTWAP